MVQNTIYGNRKKNSSRMLEKLIVGGRKIEEVCFF